MNVSNVGRRDRFTPEQEEAMRKNETTNDAAKRAHGRSGVGGPAPDVRGDDKTRREVKREQKDVHAGPLAAHAGHAAYEGAHLAELGIIHALEAKVTAAIGAAAGGAVMVGGSAILGFALGIHEILEAHEHGAAQKSALAKEAVCVSIIAVLDLPQPHKAGRLAKFPDTPRTYGSAAFKITEAIMADPKARAVIQMHCDRGITAGLDARASGMSKEAFLAAHPEIAKRYASDVAFKEGFDAATTLEGRELDELRAGVASRSPKYAAAEVQVRG